MQSWMQSSHAEVLINLNGAKPPTLMHKLVVDFVENELLLVDLTSGLKVTGEDDVMSSINAIII